MPAARSATSKIGRSVTVAFATSETWAALTPDDQLAADALARRGMDVVPAVWTDPSVAWTTHKAIVVRSTWDYHLRPVEFGAWIDMLERSGCVVWNPCALLRWNANKRYLADLDSRGVPIVPTEWIRDATPSALRDVMDARGWDDVVVKPTISATAYGTRRITRADIDSDASAPDTGLNQGELLVQPFLAEIETAGEWSLMFLGGNFSHAVRKRPVPGDFRVQSEYGGSAVAERAPPSVIAAAERALSAVEGPWLYARIDGVETRDGFLLMELEMLEPLLFLRRAPAAPARFADALITLL